MKELHPKPIPGIQMLPPLAEPTPEQVVVGYEIEKTSEQCISDPNPKRMNKFGWGSFFVLLICFWPLACVPCFTPCSYSDVQRPVYGSPGSPNKDLEFRA